MDQAHNTKARVYVAHYLVHLADIVDQDVVNDQSSVEKMYVLKESLCYNPEWLEHFSYMH